MLIQHTLHCALSLSRPSLNGFSACSNSHQNNEFGKRIQIEIAPHRHLLHGTLNGQLEERKKKNETLLIENGQKSFETVTCAVS